MIGIFSANNFLSKTFLLALFFLNSSYFQLLSAQTLMESFDPGQKEEWTVPPCVSSIIMNVRGADGGNSEDELGGAGQTIIDTFPVQPGDILEVVVGMAGGSSVGAIAASGGGGSGVLNQTTQTLLIIAGGGGGSSGERNGGQGQGGNGVSNAFVMTCNNTFDALGCGGSLYDRPTTDRSGGGGGGLYGKGEEVIDINGITGISGLGGQGGFEAMGGLGGLSSNTAGGYGVGGGGGGSGECSGGGGGGGYSGGKGGSVNPGPDGGGRGGSGYVLGITYTDVPGGNGGSTQRNGAITFTYTLLPPPALMANSTVKDNTISLSASFVASLISTNAASWQWSGPNGYSSSLNAPTPFPITTSTAGTYTVVVTDNNGCTNSAATTVAEPVARQTEDSIPTLSEWGLLIYGLLLLNLCVLLIHSGVSRFEY